MILIAEDEGRFTKKGALYLKHKYGVCGHEKLQQKQIANKYGVTRMSVNWHQMKAVNALKEAR
jgi:DNA-directed RNA polymerase specialized sigma subunit